MSRAEQAAGAQAWYPRCRSKAEQSKQRVLGRGVGGSREPVTRRRLPHMTTTALASTYIAQARATGSGARLQRGSSAHRRHAASDVSSLDSREFVMALEYPEEAAAKQSMRGRGRI